MPDKLTLCERGQCNKWRFDDMSDDQTRIFIEVCKDTFDKQKLATAVHISRDVCPFDQAASAVITSILHRAGENDAS